MAVKIRLKRMGKIRAPFYRIVVADARTKRDGRVIEQIGKYNPKLEPSLIEVDSDRAQHWLSVGAQPSEPVLALLRKTGDWQKFRGEPAPEPLKEQPEATDRLAVFNEALKEAHGDTAPDAVTSRPRKKAAKAADAEPADAEPADAEPADAKPAEAPAAETVAEEPAPVPADETPAVAAEAAEDDADQAADDEAAERKSED